MLYNIYFVAFLGILTYFIAQNRLFTFLNWRYVNEYF